MIKLDIQITHIAVHIQEVLSLAENYPKNIKFGRQKTSTNEKNMFASIFRSLFTIGSQLSSESRSSVIELLETDVFKFIVIRL